MIEEILKTIESGSNVFITGGAGSGKSYALMRLKEKLGKDLNLTASTGVASINISGTTIHSFAKLGIGTDSLVKIISKIKTDKKAEKRILNCKYLAIDEISMISAKTLNLVNTVFKAIRGSEKPFGGIVMLFFGDFLQLPPIIRNPEEDSLCLNCESWIDADIKTILLSFNYRQKNDDEFFEILSNIRFGSNLDIVYDALKTRVGIEAKKNVINLVSHKEQAFRINQANLLDLPFEEKTFTATHGGKEEFIKSYLPHFEEQAVLKFKKGARVMLNFNLNAQEGLFNGLLGNIVDFDKAGFPVVLFDGMKYGILVMQNDFMIEDPFTSEVLFWFNQIPLQLAYAITIHKSQGLTFDHVKTDISKCFAFGQAYVSLSRSKSLNGLYLSDFNKNIFKANEEVARYYRSIER